jgi:hypothetical protein
MTREQLIENLEREGWAEGTVLVWRRARYKCEYCDKDLMVCAGDYFHVAQLDHVVPGVADSLNNFALACIACNRIKRQRIFSTEPVAREETIRLARIYIQGIRERDRLRMERSRDLMLMLDQLEVAPQI